MNVCARLLVLCGLTAAAATAVAGTATTTFTVSGTVVPTCSISAAALNFGAAIPNPINSNVDGQSTVTATCSSGAPYTVALNVGTGSGATYAARRMTSGGNTLVYNLYTDPSRSQVWGDGTGGSNLSNGSGTGAAQAINVYGRITAGQTVPTGTYTDTITVTINF
ncbi:MAG TPA: spore coat U domain-containing protein [Burkholderiales bacterium]|nr:spore coat U domain-containing protein [Burkholderiales bacterium]